MGIDGVRVKQINRVILTYCNMLGMENDSEMISFF